MKKADIQKEFSSLYLFFFTPALFIPQTATVMAAATPAFGRLHTFFFHRYKQFV